MLVYIGEKRQEIINNSSLWMDGNTLYGRKF